MLFSYTGDQHFRGLGDVLDHLSLRDIRFTLIHRLHNAAMLGNTVNVSSYSTRVTLEALNKRFLPRLLDTAKAIEVELRARR